MNIFVLSKDPKVCAEYHCDKHVVKMITELAQMLSNTHHAMNSSVYNLYKPMQITNRTCKWVRNSEDNYIWTFMLWLHVLIEYRKRYSKKSKPEQLLPYLIKYPNGKYNDITHLPKLYNYNKVDFDNMPQNMPYEYRNPDPIIAYRDYYNNVKYKFAKWKLGNIPYWFTPKE